MPYLNSSSLVSDTKKWAIQPYGMRGRQSWIYKKISLKRGKYVKLLHVKNIPHQGAPWFKCHKNLIKVSFTIFNTRTRRNNIYCGWVLSKNIS